MTPSRVAARQRHLSTFEGACSRDEAPRNTRRFPFATVELYESVPPPKSSIVLVLNSTARSPACVYRTASEAVS